MISIKMYIVNHSVKSEERVKQLTDALESVLGNDYDLEILNVIECPEIALRDNVFATPTVIRTGPGSMRRIIGDMGDRSRVLLGLGLSQNGTSCC